MLRQIELFINSRGYSDSTKTTYRYILQLLLKTLPDPKELDSICFDKWLKSQKWGDSTKYIAYCAVRGFIKWLYGNTHPALAFKLKHIEAPPQRTLTDDEVEKLYQIMPVNDFGRRDTAIVSLSIDTGLRASELCALQLSHLFLGDQNYLETKVKGGKWEIRGFSIYTALDLDNWLAIRDQYAIKGVDTVFVSLGGSKPGTSLTRDGLRPIVRKWAKAANLEHFSPHAFRRTGVTIAVENGASDQMAMRQFGWKHATQVKRYTRKLTANEFAKRYSPVAHVRNGNINNEGTLTSK